IAWDELKEFENGDTEVRLRSTVLAEAPDLTKPRVSLVSLLKEPSLTIQLNGAPISLVPKTAAHREFPLDSVVKVTHESGELMEIEIERVATYLVFLYRDPESGELGTSFIQNEKLEYQSPPEAENEEE
ncbi:MAG: hypothetical protein AAGC68_01020, partial [Verrucomicrobiota bacterium]